MFIALDLSSRALQRSAMVLLGSLHSAPMERDGSGVWSYKHIAPSEPGQEAFWQNTLDSKPDYCIWSTFDVQRIDETNVS